MQAKIPTARSTLQIQNQANYHEPSAFARFLGFVKTSKCATPRQECSKPTLSSSLTDMNAFVLPNDQHSIFPGSILEAP
jgi:hypothetical protein